MWNLLYYHLNTMKATTYLNVNKQKVNTKIMWSCELPAIYTLVYIEMKEKTHFCKFVAYLYRFTLVIQKNLWWNMINTFYTVDRQPKSDAGIRLAFDAKYEASWLFIQNIWYDIEIFFFLNHHGNKISEADFKQLSSKIGFERNMPSHFHYNFTSIPIMTWIFEPHNCTDNIYPWEINIP